MRERIASLTMLYSTSPENIPCPEGAFVLITRPLRIEVREAFFTSRKVASGLDGHCMASSFTAELFVVQIIEV